MKKFKIEWETDLCEDFPEKSGIETIEAENEEEARKKFYDLNRTGIIFDITEVK